MFEKSEKIIRFLEFIKLKKITCNNRKKTEKQKYFDMSLICLPIIMFFQFIARN